MPNLAQIFGWNRLPGGRLLQAANASVAPISLVHKIAEGGSRECWRHPQSSQLCIKVNKPNRQRDQNRLDWHYARSLMRRKVAGPHLPKYHGLVMTDRGEGLVMDLVVDHDGTPSLTFLEALRSHAFTREQITMMVDEAFDWIRRKNIIVADYGYDNLMVQAQADGTYRLVFIDGLGGRYFNLRYRIRSRFSIPQPRRAQEFRDKLERVIQQEYGSIRH